jgi:iron(III) transport system substrate-binding protein
MIKSKYVVCIILCVFLFSGSKAVQGQTLEALHKAAKAEGVVTIWSPNAEVRDIQVVEFNKEFPEIRVNFFEIRPSDYVPKVIAEARQGRLSLDAGSGRYAAVAPLIERGLIQAYEDWTKVFHNLNSEAISKDGRFLANGDNVFVVSYSTNLVAPSDVPTSWDDLLDPKWKGKIILEPRGVAFAYLGLKWGEEKMVDYVRKLKGQVASFVKGGTAVAQQLAAGAGHIAVGAYGYKILELKSDGAPVDYARKVSPVAATGQDVFVMNGAQHPNAAKLLVGWLASEKGQQLLEAKALKGSMIPGSSYVAWKDAKKHGVEVIREDSENYKRAGALAKVAAKAMGVFK